MKTGKTDLVSGVYLEFQMACLKALPRRFSEADFLFWARNSELLSYALGRAVEFDVRESLLTEKKRIDIPAIEKFVANKVFKPCGAICEIDERFTRRFLKKTEGSTDAATIVSYRVKEAYEAAIILELGRPCIMTLGQLWYLLCSQNNGQKGFLLTGGEVNTVYAIDCSGVLAPVNVYWSSVRAGWYVQGGLHLTVGMLADARQVLSRAA